MMGFTDAVLPPGLPLGGQPVVLQPGQTAVRRIGVLVADGRLTHQQAAARAAAEEAA